MACGTGKTLIGLWVAEELESERTLVLLPSLSLLAQTLREWTANAKRPFVFLPVCSDETVRGADHFVSNTSELGFPVTTNPVEIAAFLGADGPRVVFSTYQSSPRIAEALERSGASFDLTIADEAHRTAGPVSSDFATILDSDAIRAERRLFQTATPRYFTDRVRKVAGEAEYDIASMDDESHFGPEFHCLSFGEAIERDLLSDYQVVIVGVDHPTYREYVERGTIVTRDGRQITDARYLASMIALAKAMRKYDLRRTISFHSRVKRAREFASEFPDVVAWMPADERPEGKLWSDYVSGRMQSGQRDRRLKRLRGLNQSERGLLTNARCLGEGVDVPTLDGIAFIDPRGSQVDIIQAVGRAIRKSEDKSVGTIVLPVFVAADEDPNEALRRSTFKPVWAVLKALRAHDEQFADELDTIRREAGEFGSAPALIPAKVRLDIPSSVGLDFIEAIEARLIEQATESWEFWYGLLSRYVKREGDALVPALHMECGYALGRWVRKQRLSQKEGWLTSMRASRLEKFGGWEWEPDEAVWQDRFSLVEDYARIHGHPNVPKKHRVGDVWLGNWIDIQRGLFRSGELPSDRRSSLESIPGWEWNPRSTIWPRYFKALEAFANREGHSRVPVSHVEAGLQLGQWTVNQRAAYKAGRLSPARQRHLESVPGWTWDLKASDWHAAFQYLQTYVQREGHARVPQSHVEGGFRLGQWLSVQRQTYRKGKLSDYRRGLLERLPGWEWNTTQASWTKAYELLRQYAASEGHLYVPAKLVVDGFALGAWVNTQRTKYGTGTLSPDRVACLESLDGWVWNTRDALFERSFALLKRYSEVHGSARVERKTIYGGIRLGQWVASRRLDYRKGRLDPNRVARLESLPGWTWDARKAKDK
jgi:superfamily II DNA or RNA helicase